MKTWLTDKEFSLHAQKGTVPEDTCIRKGMLADVTPESEDLTLRFAISTPSVDRSRDVITAEGWDLKDYKKNSVIAWSHDYSIPAIGRSKRTWVEDGKLKAIAEFTPKDLHPFGYMIFGLYKSGFMNAASVGFMPGEWNFDEKRGGVNFLKQSLLEFSAVLVPDNQDALMERGLLAKAKASGLDLGPMREWMERAIEELHGEPGLWLPRETVERALKALGSMPFISLSSGSGSKTIGTPAFIVSANTPVSLPVAVAINASASAVAVPAVAKQKPECPNGTACPNTMNSAECPMGKDCPMMASAMTSVDARDGYLILEVLEVPESITHGLILDMADEPETYDEALVRQLLAESVAESIMPMVAREVREALTALTGRLD